jgi:hypothetical protein
MAYQASRRLQILPPLAARTAPASGAAFAGVARLQQDSGGQSRAEQNKGNELSLEIMCAAL